MTPKFTKGPWKNHDARGLNIGSNDGKTFVCRVQPRVAYQGPKTTEEAQANAALIKAAPKLFEAAQAMLSNLDTFQYESAKERLRAVLKEAMGE